LAVDARGTLYVADKSDPRIDIIDSQGEVAGSIGGRDQEGWDIGVISSLVADSRGRLFVLAGDVHVLTPTGKRLGRFSSKGARALAVDAAGAIYSVTSYNRVIKYEVLLGG
jgi:sugar lactone lactonase YvrE